MKFPKDRSVRLVAASVLIAILAQAPPPANAAPIAHATPTAAGTSFWTNPLATDAPLSYTSPSSDVIAQEALRQSGPGFATRGFYSPNLNTSAYTPHLYVVPATQPMVKLHIDKPVGLDGSLNTVFDPTTAIDNGIPLPPDAVPAAGTDAEIAIYQPDWNDGTGNGTGRLYDMWQFRPASTTPDGIAHASWGGRLSYVSTSPGHWVDRGTSPLLAGFERSYWGTTATSLPLYSGTLRISELQSGYIDHAFGIALTYATPAPAHVWPAQRSDGYYPTAWAGSEVPEGTRLRLPANFVINPAWPAVVQMLCQGARDYGVVVWDLSGGTSIRLENPKSSDLINGANPYTGRDSLGNQTIPVSQTLFQGKAGWELAQQFWTVAGPSMRTLAPGSD